MHSKRMTRDQVRGCLLGGAVGDALGAPVEFMSIDAIRDKYGPDGIADLDRAYGRVGAITDDTQMTLWTAEGMLRGITRNKEKGIGGPKCTIPFAYRRWLYTQDRRLPSRMDRHQRSLTLGDGDDMHPGWLLSVRELHAARAPGNTCLRALRAPELGTRERPLNGSKGCGGVMRVAPLALPPTDPEVGFDVACEAAALTHGHVTGWLASGALVWLLCRVRDGVDLETAAIDTVDRISREPGHEETSRALLAAWSLWRTKERPTPERVESLGVGWVAEQALAIAVYAALASGGDFETGVRIAVNHSGDSDSTGSIAGQILGLALGESAIPRRWLERLELREEITAMADDIVTLYREGPEWWARYPGY